MALVEEQGCWGPLQAATSDRPLCLDFYCPKLKLAIEIDGIAHDMGDRPKHDDVRDAWLRDQRIDVIRTPAADILKDVTTVADHIRLLCLERG